MKQEAKYFDLIDLINSGYEVNTSSASENSSTNPFDSGNTTPNPFNSGNTTPNPFEKTAPNPFGHIFEVDI